MSHTMAQDVMKGKAIDVENDTLLLYNSLASQMLRTKTNLPNQ